jgi:hypothetical protein
MNSLHLQSNTPILIEMRRRPVLISTFATNRAETRHLGIVQGTGVFLALHVLLVSIILSSMVSQDFYSSTLYIH